MKQLTTLIKKLERLQEFKKPLTKIINSEVYGINTEPDDFECQFSLLNCSEECFEDIDEELDKTFKKLARLLEIREDSLKQELKNFI